MVVVVAIVKRLWWHSSGGCDISGDVVVIISGASICAMMAFVKWLW